MLWEPSNTNRIRFNGGEEDVFWANVEAETPDRSRIIRYFSVRFKLGDSMRGRFHSSAY
jgi:hypothetical protein